MERLTFEGNFCDIAQCREIRGGTHCPDGACSQRKVWERLKEYEDAEERGHLFRTPVKVGDAVYSICFDEVANEWVVGDEPERILEVGTKGFFLASCLSYPDDPDEFHPYEEIGDEFFLSHDDAVAAASVKCAPTYDESEETETA